LPCFGSSSGSRSAFHLELDPDSHLSEELDSDLDLYSPERLNPDADPPKVNSDPIQWIVWFENGKENSIVHTLMVLNIDLYLCIYPFG
jgi:hypothetical protein